MTVWLWVIVGLAAFLALSAGTGLAIAAILGQIGREVSDLLDSQLWTTAPLAREASQETLGEPPVEQSRSDRVGIILMKSKR